MFNNEKLLAVAAFLLLVSILGMLTAIVGVWIAQ